MSTFLLLHHSGRLYFSKLRGGSQSLEEFETDLEKPDLPELFSAFCSQVSSDFNIRLYSDELSYKRVEVQSHNSNLNPKLVDQLTSTQLEQTLIMPLDIYEVEKLKSKDSSLCLLIESELKSELLKICRRNGGKLLSFAHSAGIYSNLTKVPSVEIYDSFTLCKKGDKIQVFNLNSNLPVEFNATQNWIETNIKGRLNCYNHSSMDAIPLECTLLDTDWNDVSSKAFTASVKKLSNKVPVFQLVKKRQFLKKSAPVLLSLFVSTCFFTSVVLFNKNEVKGLENSLKDTRKKLNSVKSSIEERQRKAGSIAKLEQQIKKYESERLLLNSEKFWPEFLAILAKSVDEKTQLTEIRTINDREISVRGRSLDALSIDQLAQGIVSMNIEINEKTVSKTSELIWDFTLKVRREK